MPIGPLDEYAIVQTHMVNRYGVTYQKRIVVSIRKSTIRLDSGFVFYPAFSFVAYLGKLGYCSHRINKVKQHMEELK